MCIWFTIEIKGVGLSFQIQVGMVLGMVLFAPCATLDTGALIFSLSALFGSGMEDSLPFSLMHGQVMSLLLLCSIGLLLWIIISNFQSEMELIEGGIWIG